MNPSENKPSRIRSLTPLWLFLFLLGWFFSLVMSIQFWLIYEPESLPEYYARQIKHVPNRDLFADLGLKFEMFELAPPPQSEIFIWIEIREDGVLNEKLCRGYSTDTLDFLKTSKEVKPFGNGPFSPSFTVTRNPSKKITFHWGYQPIPNENEDNPEQIKHFFTIKTPVGSMRQGPVTTKNLFEGIEQSSFSDSNRIIKVEQDKTYTLYTLKGVEGSKPISTSDTENSPNIDVRIDIKCHFKSLPDDHTPTGSMSYGGLPEIATQED